MGGLPFFFFVWLFSGLGGKKRRDLTTRAPADSAPPPPPAATAATPAQAAQASLPTPPPANVPIPIVTPATPVAVKYSEPVPWPQVVPAGLPGFPGSSWTPDIPVGPGVAARASQLLPQLWKSGEGTFKTEQTSGRWITYRATKMGTLKGVVAYRLVNPAGAISPGGTYAVAPRTATSSSTVPASYSEPSSSVSLPTLRRGAKGPSVVTLQQRLGIEADGDFGPKTERAVIAFQSSRGLSPDGVVGKNTWTALYT